MKPSPVVVELEKAVRRFQYVAIFATVAMSVAIVVNTYITIVRIGELP